MSTVYPYPRAARILSNCAIHGEKHAKENDTESGLRDVPARDGSLRRAAGVRGFKSRTPGKRRQGKTSAAYRMRQRLFLGERVRDPARREDRLFL
jgi:hypothetical protein